MDYKQIQELIKLINKTDISEVKIEEENFKITLRKSDYLVHKNRFEPPITVPYPQPVAQPMPGVPTAQQPAAGGAAPAQEEPKTEKTADTSEENLITFKSPMIGTFYRSPAPDKDTYVSVGDDIKKGTVLCIIEAMKLFNEIESEVEGKIVKVLVEDASPVEYDQPLFLIEPSK